MILDCVESCLYSKNSSTVIGSHRVAPQLASRPCIGQMLFPIVLRLSQCPADSSTGCVFRSCCVSICVPLSPHTDVPLDCAMTFSLSCRHLNKMLFLNILRLDLCFAAPSVWCSFLRVGPCLEPRRPVDRTCFSTGLCPNLHPTNPTDVCAFRLCWFLILSHRPFGRMLPPTCCFFASVPRPPGYLGDFLDLICPDWCLTYLSAVCLVICPGLPPTNPSAG